MWTAPQYKCPHCEYTTPNEKGRKTHIRNTHEHGLKKYMAGEQK